MLSGGRFTFAQMSNSEDKIFSEMSLQSKDSDPGLKFSRTPKIFVLLRIIRNVVGFQYSVVNAFLEKRSGMDEPAEQAHYTLQMLLLF